MSIHDRTSGDLATALVRFDAAPGDPYRPTATPIYQTATFEQPTATAFGQYDYTRTANPTRDVLNEQLAALEGGVRALTYTSGMAALNAVCELVEAGGHVLAGDDLYGGTWRLLSRVLPRRGVSVSYADATDPERFAAAFRPETRLVLLETPTNPLQRIVDVRAIAALTRAHGALLAVDNTVMSPYLQRPLDLGADVVIHSATKALCGHGDVMAGAAVVRDPAVGDELAFLQNATGNGLAPFDCYLLLRGTRTLAARIDRAQRTTHALADWLVSHPAVTAVHYVGRPEHPGYTLHHGQADGAGALLAFETGAVGVSAAVVEQTRLFTTAVSFGSVAASISLPCAMSHASIPAEVRAERALPEDLVRVSVGLEALEDLIADLDRALNAAAGTVRAAG